MLCRFFEMISLNIFDRYKKKCRFDALHILLVIYLFSPATLRQSFKPFSKLKISASLNRVFLSLYDIPCTQP